MKKLYEAVFLLLGIIVEYAGAQLMSSVDSSAVCPGERVTFTCTVDSSTHDWAITDGTTEQDIAIVTPANPSATDLGFELTVVDITAAPITSTATVNATTDLNGTVIVCRNELVPPNAIQQNTTVTIIGAPTAPNIAMLFESSPTDNSITIRANLQPPVYGSECIQNYTVIARADGEEDVVVDSTLPGDVFVQVTVCPRQYTFTALACSSVGCSGESAPMTIDIPDGLHSVSNIVDDGGNLTWNPPQNAPPGCITSYTIAWDNGMFTTPDDSTSIPIGNISGLEICRTYTSITVTPIVPPFGAIQSSSGERLNVALLPSGFPRPGDIILSDVTYTETGIDVTASWQNSEQLVSFSSSSSNVTVGDNVTNMETQFREPNLANLHTFRSIPYDGSIDRTVAFTVSFMTDNCTATNNTDRRFPNIIGPARSILRTTSSLGVAIPYVQNVTIVTVDVRGTATPSDGSHNPIVITVQGPIRGSELSFVFSNLNAGTGYTCVFEAVSSNNPSAHIGLPIDLVLQTRTVAQQTALIGGVVGGILAFIVVIVIVVIIIIIVIIMKNKKGEKDEDMELTKSARGSSPAPVSPPAPVSSLAADSGAPTAVYADPNTIQREEFPGTQDVYTVPDKKTKKHKPEDHLPTYQDPGTISHEAAPSGDFYAQPDKPKKGRGSKKTQPEPTPHTEAELAEMYSQPDKSKKQQNQGLMYTEIGFQGESGKAPDTRPGVFYSDVKPHQ